MVSYMISTIKIGISNIIESQTPSHLVSVVFSGSLFTFLKLTIFKFTRFFHVHCWKVTPAYEMYEQLSFIYIYYSCNKSCWQPLWQLRNPHGMPTFKTEALRLVSNVQLVKGLLPCNEQQIQRYLALL